MGLCALVLGAERNVLKVNLAAFLDGLYSMKVLSKGPFFVVPLFGFFVTRVAINGISWFSQTEHQFTPRSRNVNQGQTKVKVVFSLTEGNSLGFSTRA